MEQFFNDYLNRVQEIHQHMIDVLDALPDTAVNWQPALQEINCIAVLVTHAMGAERFWIGDVALGAPSNRIRSNEFINEAKTCAQLKALIQTTQYYVAGVLPQLTLADLATPKRLPQHTRDFTVGWALLHALEHTAVHAGHMQIMRQLWENEPA